MSTAPRRTWAARLAPVVARLREPSTWAAMGVLALLAGAPMPPGLTDAAPELVALACAILAAVMREGPPPPPPPAP